MKVALMGYYGSGDVGDEAILDGIISLLSPLNVDICVFSLNPLHTMAKHNIRSSQSLFVKKKINRSKILSFMYFKLILIPVFLKNALTISQSDLLILGGGGLIQDGYREGKTKLLKYLFYPLTAKILRKKTMILSVGVGPLNSRFSKFSIKSTFNLSNTISVRDEESKKLLKSIGVSKKIYVIPDPALVLEPQKMEFRHKIRSKETLIGVCINGWIKGYREGKSKHKSKYGELVKALDILSKNNNAQIVFIPTAGAKDDCKDPLAMEMSDALAKPAIVLPGEFSPNEVMNVFNEMDVIISMRLHAIILSSLVYVPHMGIITDKKMMNFLKMTKQQKHSLYYEELNAGNLIKIIEDVLKNRDKIKKELQLNVKELKNRAVENRILIKSTLEP